MRTVVITGANVGIGFATAKTIAALPEWHVVLACRNASKANAALAEIRQAHPDSHVRFAPLDLFSLASVRRFPALLTEITLPPLGGLILNAGGINMKAKSLEFTEDGFERTCHLNFLGHFLLANLLVNQMSAQARVIFVSSDLHDPAATRMGKIMPPKFGPVEDLAHATGTAARLKPMARYGTAKMYAMMTAYELDRRLRAAKKSISVNSWSPGVVPTTQAGRDMNPLMKRIMTSRWFVNFMGSHLSTEEEAGKALCELLNRQEYSGLSGRYFDGFREIPSSAESRNERKAKLVWEQASRLVGLSRSEAKPYPTSTRVASSWPASAAH